MNLIAKLAGILCIVLCSCCITGAQHLSDKSRSHSAFQPFDIRTIDPGLFKDAYAILGMERLMHPIDMADWPLKIGSERQLFVDDFLIASCQGLTRQLHQPVPHPDNPVMKTREHPWEEMDGFSLFVLRDEQNGQFRMWYNSRIIYEAENGLRYRGPTGYATSADGVHWTKPDLGLVKYGPDRHNNIVLGEGSINGLFYEPHTPDLQKRYKALVWHDPREQAEYAPREGLYLYWSPDGIHWKGDSQTCVMPLRTGPDTTFPETLVPGMGDTTNFIFDTKLNKYVCNGKILFRNPTMRTIAHSESDDLVHWTRPIMTMHRGQLDGDNQIGEITRIPYESMWLGLLGMYHWDRGWKQKHQQLAASRDGRHWYRVNPREAFIPLGAEDSWEPDFTIAGRPGPLLIGDELWFYYTGRQRAERFQEQGIDAPHNQHVGLAKLRRDGFVSLRAGDKPGELVTRPLTFAGSRLYVNVATEPGGYLEVGVRTRDGEPVSGFALKDANRITGDGTRILVTWSRGTDIPLPAGKHVRLQFRLKNADLYSFWIE